MKQSSVLSAFHWRTGEPSVFRPLQTAANLRAASTAKVERARKQGVDRSVIHGLSKKADVRVSELRHQNRFSPPIENADEGQRSRDRRDAIRRGGI
ncbi:hypothetical protein ACQ858_08305 [Variovorax ureilyticus]|uniref:hypothetical protein n=1 Tax=Variovorax ureilyticus TaxID=1836198 RepID=UPI003D66B6EC